MCDHELNDDCVCIHCGYDAAELRARYVAVCDDVAERAKGLEAWIAARSKAIE